MVRFVILQYCRIWNHELTRHNMLCQCLAEYCGQFYVFKCESSYEFVKLYGYKNSVKQHTFIAYIPLSFEI